MQKLEAAVIPMRKCLDLNQLSQVTYLTGDATIASNLPNVAPKAPFDAEIIDFLNDVSKIVMTNKEARHFSDVITFAFWIRKASTLALKERFVQDDGMVHLGKGVVFHVAPSNVPVNFAYSMVSGLLSGNANIVRVPSKDFNQVSILAKAFNEALEHYPNIKSYVILVRYGHERAINDIFSSIADMRIVWGGDETINELRNSPLPPRSGEITFADRYSIAVINSDSYLEMSNKEKVVEDFYNDTFFSDQNACTSPRIVIWMGNHKTNAKELFWQQFHKLVEKKYILQPAQSVNKLTSAYLTSVAFPGSKVVKQLDNLIIRVEVPQLTETLMDYKDNSGYFLEYECNDLLDLKPLCDDSRCQTIAYIGDISEFIPLLKSGIKGIDRVVPIGKTMDFDLVWDGYDLMTMLTRRISI